MSTVTAKLNEAKAFTGGANVINCKLLPTNSNGVQIQADGGVVLEDCTVKVRCPHSDAWQTIELEEGSGAYALVGKDFFLAEIEISGATAGTYVFIFRQ